MPTPGVTCKRCFGRIDEQAHNLKKRIHARVHKDDGVPFTPPHICSECLFAAMLEFSLASDEGEKG